MMDQHDFDERDEALLGDLRSAVSGFDPVPPAVLAAGYAAIEFRDLDGQLAELLRDTATQDKELAGVRGTGGGRLLTFGLGDRFVEVEIAADGDGRSVTGYVVPAATGTVAVDCAGGPVEVELDPRGRFRMPKLPRGPIRLRLLMPGLPALLTPWTGI